MNLFGNLARVCSVVWQNSLVYVTYTIKKELQKFCNLRFIRIFAVTVSAALPIRTANQGGTFTFTSYEIF